MSEINTKAQLDRLTELRKKAENISKRKATLEGELFGVTKRLKDLKEKCVADFEVEPEALPELITKLNEKAEKFLSEAEKTVAGVN